MIARLWSAKTNEPRSRAYLEHFSKNVLPSLRGLKGYAGAIILTRQTKGEVEILVTTLWKTLAAIREFAGENIEVAVVADEAAAILTDFDRRARHYEVVMSDIREHAQISSSTSL